MIADVKVNIATTVSDLKEKVNVLKTKLTATNTLLEDIDRTDRGVTRP